MKRKFLLTVALITAAGFAIAKENLAILPFTGGSGSEGETIAELFSFDARLGEAFNIIPRTSISRAISNERRFQTNSGMTDPDTAVSIAGEVGARYVVAGSVTSVGNNNLLVISILDIRNLQQIAGDFQTYPQGRIENLRGRLPGMAENIIRATTSNTAALPKLAIVPVQLEGGTDRRVADTLAQLLAIHLIRSGKYAVFPRTGSLEQVQAEHDAQMSGHTADKNIIGTGHGENPDYVLSVVARRLGSVNMFNAVIIDLLTRVQAVGRSVDYQDINDGMRAMETLSVVLTSSTAQTGQRQQEQDQQGRPARTREPAQYDPVKDAWKNKWVYLGGGLGIGSYNNTYNHYNSNTGKWENNGEEYTDLLFAAGFVAELALLPFLSMELDLAIGGNDLGVVPVIPILAKLGGRIAKVELSFDIGYMIGLGFTLGGTFGFKAGPGVLFAKFLTVPNANGIDENITSALVGFVGYKAGLGNKKPWGQSKATEEGRE